MDLNKEIKLGDLFRRKAKDTAEAPEQAKQPKAPKEPRRALFARQEKAPKQPKEPKAPKEPRRALFARQEKAPKQPKEPKAPKESKARKEKGARQEPRAAAVPPAIPLMRAFNLLPREEVAETRARLGLAQVLVALLGLLVVAGLGTGYLFMGARVADKQGQVDDLRVELAGLDVPAEGPSEAPDPSLATESQARTAALAGALTGRVAWDRILREMTLVVPEEIFLTSVTAQTPGAAAAGAAPPPADPAAATTPAPGSTMTIVGTSDSQEAVARFLARLGVIPELVSVQLQSSTAENPEAGARFFTFTIAVTVDPAGGQA